MRSEFELLPFVAVILDDNFIFVEHTNEYTHKNHTEHRVSLGFLNGAWLVYQHQQSKVDELTQLYAKELFNKKVVAKKAAKQIVELQLKNDELQKRVDAVQALVKRWKAYKGLDIKEIALLHCANDLEQALKGGGE